MVLPQNSDKLIYISLADWIEDSILSGIYPEDSQIPSVAELSANFRINHITALRGISILTDLGIIYKKRGIGMFVARGAMEKIRQRRRDDFYDKYIRSAVAEAKKLGLSEDEMTELVKRGYGNDSENREHN